MADDMQRGKRTGRKAGLIALGVLVVGVAAFFLIRFYYPFGEGIKTGQLNYVVYKGVVFKTYEGKLIQSGFQTDEHGIRSNEFIFSVKKKEVAEELMHAGGQMVELHYKEYFGALPWRGYSKYIVDSIVNIVPAAHGTESLPPFDPSGL